MNESTKTLSLTEDAPRVILAELPGDLHVVGTESLEVSLLTDDESATLEQDAEGLVQVRSGGDLVLRLPAKASLDVRAVRGDARIQSVGGRLDINEVNGDLKLRDVGPTRIGRVYGDLRANTVQGDLWVEAVFGDAAVRTVTGALNLERVQADALVRGAAGSVQVSAGADATVELSVPGEHRLDAGADLRVIAGPTFAGILELRAGGDRRIDLPEGRLRTEERDGMTRITVLAERAMTGVAADEADEPAPDADLPTVALRSGGDFALTQPGAASRDARWQARVEFRAMGDEFRAIGDEFRQLAERVTRRVHAHVGDLGSQLHGRFGQLADNLTDILSAAGMSMEEAEAVSERIRSAGERAGLRAQEKMDQMRRRREEDGGDARRGSWEWIGRAVDGARPAPPAPPAPPSPPVGSEERLSVLRLLEAGRISADEAERLLKAMAGGRSVA